MRPGATEGGVGDRTIEAGLKINVVYYLAGNQLS